MGEPRASVIIGPRERHSGILECIESLYEHTPSELFRLVVVQGDLPAHVRAGVDDAAARLGFEFIHEECALRPNEARNIGLKHVDTEWTVFSDNDVQFSDGWLERLLEAGDERDAWLVTPVITHGPIERGWVHVAGPELIEEPAGEYLRHTRIQSHQWDHLHEIRPTLERRTCTDVEFHVLLARTNIFDVIGPLDEDLVSKDHTDLAREVTRAGGTIVFEPESVVGYIGSNTDADCLQRSDLGYFLLRFSDVWNEASFRALEQKWHTEPDPHMRTKMEVWVRRIRIAGYGAIYGKVMAKLTSKRTGPIGDAIDRKLFERHAGPLIERRVALGRQA